MKPLLLCCVFIFLMIKANAQKINTDTTTKKTNDTIKVSDTSTYIPQKYRNIHKRIPELACFLSLCIPGAGQVYNKQYLKGELLFGVFTISVAALEIYTDNYNANQNAKALAAFHANHDYTYQGPSHTVRVALITPLLVAYFCSVIDAPVSASYLNRTYHLGKKKKEFTSLHISPDLINAGIGNKYDAGISLILR